MEWTCQNGSAAGEIPDDRSILIVDDDGDCRLLLRTWLTAEGFRVTCAAGGDEALALMRSQPFSLMLTDYNMPGMDGLRLAEEALKVDPALAIVMATATPLPKLRSEAANRGIAALLAKPFDAAELLRVLRRAGRRSITPLPPANRQA